MPPSIEDRAEEGPVTRFEAATEDQESLIAEARQAMAAGDSDTAITALLALEDTVSASEVRSAGMLLLSELYYREGDLDAALATLTALQEEVPPYAELEFLLGQTYRAAEEYSKAEESFRRAIRFDATLLTAYLHLAEMLYGNDRIEDGDEVLLAFEREIFRMSDRLEEDLQPEEKVEILMRMASGIPDTRVARTVARCLVDESPAVRNAALGAIAVVGTPDVLDELDEFAQRERSPEIRALAQAARERIEAREESRGR